VRVTIRVRPGASRTAVGGRYADALVDAVQARAVDGAATKAALEALADALGIRRREVTLLTGTSSRTKTVEVPDAAASRLADLMREAD
jgi:uncharacterized protein YggU (UPF0235/DUF167 family)